MKRLRQCISAVLACSIATVAAARTSLPAGSLVYGVLDERVTSRIQKDGWDQGDTVRAHVWRDVVVDGVTVIKAGTPMMVRISTIKKAKMAGIKGKLELEAIATTSVDGDTVPLSGGYDKSGHGRMGLSISLAAVVAWPLIFIKGKAAVLDSGTVFDATTEIAVHATVTESTPRKIRLGGSSLSATVLYDSMDPEGKSNALPIRLESCTSTLESAAVVSVNEKAIERIPMPITDSRSEGDCRSATATTDLKSLGKHLAKGINRFEIESGGEVAEVVLDIEL